MNDKNTKNNIDKYVSDLNSAIFSSRCPVFIAVEEGYDYDKYTTYRKITGIQKGKIKNMLDGLSHYENCVVIKITDSDYTLDCMKVLTEDSDNYTSEVNKKI